jgi:hypothetical protein
MTKEQESDDMLKDVPLDIDQIDLTNYRLSEVPNFQSFTMLNVKTIKYNQEIIIKTKSNQTNSTIISSLNS